MSLERVLFRFSDLRRRSGVDTCASAEPQEERKTMDVPQPRPRRRKPLDAGPFQPEIGSFRLHLAAQGKAILLVDQNIKGAIGISDHVYVMRTGTLLEEGPRSAFTDSLETLVSRWLYTR